VRYKELVKLVVWGATLENDLPANSNLSLPSLQELSFCGVKNLASITNLFTRSSLLSLHNVAIVYSPLPSDDFLSRLPVETSVVATSEMRKTLLPAALETTLYTNRFWSIAEGFTDLGERPLKHLQLSDYEGPTIFSAFLQLTSELKSDTKLETIYLPKSCQSCNDVRLVEEWCEQRRIRLLFEEEIDFMHESLVPESFVEMCEDQATRRVGGS
jgi:hypothetical protein